MDPHQVAPFTPPAFIQRVLVPETAVRMIMEDLGQDYREAVKTLRDSARYGVAMFPDNNNSPGTAGEAIVKERAKARRREIEEEEATEIEASERETRSRFFHIFFRGAVAADCHLTCFATGPDAAWSLPYWITTPSGTFTYRDQ